MKNEGRLTVGKVLLVYEISRQVLPTAPSPTVTHFMNLEALIFPPLKPTPKYKKETPQIFTWGQGRSLTHTKIFFALAAVVPGCASIEHLCCTNAEWIPHKEYSFHGLQQNSYSSSSFKKQRKTKTESFLKFYWKFQKANIGEKMKMHNRGKYFKREVMKFETLTLLGELQGWW